MYDESPDGRPSRLLFDFIPADNCGVIELMFLNRGVRSALGIPKLVLRVCMRDVNGERSGISLTCRSRSPLETEIGESET